MKEKEPLNYNFDDEADDPLKNEPDKPLKDDVGQIMNNFEQNKGKIKNEMGDNTPAGRIKQKTLERSKKPFYEAPKEIKQITKPKARISTKQLYEIKTPKGVSLKMIKEQFGHDQDIKFVWRDVLPKSMPVMLCGREGSGKTTNALQIAREIIENHDSGFVVWLATEGAVLDTIDKASKIGLDNPRFVFARKSDESYKFEFSRRSDLDELDTLLEEIGGPVLAVFIDSIRGMSKHGDSDDANGRIMHTINAICYDKHKATLMYLDHHKKGAAPNLLDKTSGSTSKTSAVRLVLAIENKSKVTRTIKPAKINIFKQIPELESIQVGNQIHIRELKTLDDQSMTDKCEAWLSELMSDKKEMWASEVYDLAKLEGFSDSTVKKAKKNLPIPKPKQIDKKHKWFWELN